MNRRIWIYLAVAISFVLRVGSLSRIEPGNDEIDYWSKAANEILQANFRLPEGWFAHETFCGRHPLIPERSGIASSLAPPDDQSWSKKAASFPPLYPYLGAAVARIGGCSTLFSLRLVSAAANSLSALLIYLIGENLFSPVAGVLGFIFCLTQILSTSTSTATSHPLFIFWTLSFMLAYQHSLQNDRSIRYPLLAGIFLGLAILSQWTGLLVLGSFVVHLILQKMWFKRDKSYRYEILLVLIAIGIVLPYAVILLSNQVNPIFYYLKYNKVWKKASGSRLTVWGIDLAGPFLALGMFATLFHGSVKHLWRIISASPVWLKPPIAVFILVPLFLFVLAFIGAADQAEPGKKPMVNFIQTYLLAFISFYMLYAFKFTTYWVTVFPLVYLLLARYICHSASGAARFKKLGIIFMAVYLVSVNTAASVFFLKVGGEHGAVKEAVLFMEQNARGKFAVAFQYPSLIAYHLERLNHPAQIISLDQIRDLSTGPDYILMREDYIKRYFTPEQLSRYYRPALKAENNISPFRDYFLYQKI